MEVSLVGSVRVAKMLGYMKMREHVAWLREAAIQATPVDLINEQRLKRVRRRMLHVGLDRFLKGKGRDA